MYEKLQNNFSLKFSPSLYLDVVHFKYRAYKDFQVFISISFFSRHIIDSLSTYTQYLVSLQVINPKGAGPSSTVVVMTNEGGKKGINKISF